MGDVVNVLIIEDEIYWSDFLQVAIKKIGFSVAGVANDLESALQLLNTADFDIALVDINLNGKRTGIDIGKLISGTYKAPFVFITSDVCDATMKDVVEAAPSAFLNKPVSATSLLVAINNALEKATDDATYVTIDSFFVKQGNSFRKIYWADVVCLAVNQNYTQVITRLDKTTYLIRSTLNKTLTNIVPKSLQKEFVRINRAEAINASFIQEVTGNTIITAYGSFDVTDTHLQELKKHLRMVL